MRNKSPSASASNRLSVFTSWCNNNGIWVDPRLNLAATADGAGIGVFSTALIDNSIAVVKIPKSRVLSQRSCSFAHVFSLSDDGEKTLCHEPTLILTFVLLLELRRGEVSPWWGYLQSLPQQCVDLALFWPLDRVDENTYEAMKWLKGTELLKLLEREMASTLPAIEKYHRTVIQPTLQSLGQESASFNEFLHAFSLVSSRAFHVDSYHQIALVPVADAFNHIEEHHVHLETDYHVCSTCGSLEECQHDDDNEGRPTPPQPSPLSPDPAENTCEMVTNTFIIPDTEVFNTYDRALNNAQLMVQYGFWLEGNGNDVVQWDLERVDEVLGYGLDEEDGDEKEGYDELRLWARCANVPLFASSGLDSEAENEVHRSYLIYAPPDNRPSPEHLDDISPADAKHPNRTLDPRAYLHINADGQISQQLWLYILFHHIPFTQVRELLQMGDDTFGRFLQRCAEVQTGMESDLGLVCEVDVDANVDLAAVSRDIVCLCSTRIRGMYRSEMPVPYWVQLIDETSHPRIRAAMSIALSERLVLEQSCAAWDEFEKTMTPHK